MESEIVFMSQSEESDEESASEKESESASSPIEATAPPVSPPVKPRAQILARVGDVLEIGGALFQEAEMLLKSGQKKRLRVRMGSKILAEVPLATGAVAVLASVMLAVAVTRLTIEVE